MLLTPTLLFLLLFNIGHSLTELFPLWTMARDVRISYSYLVHVRAHVGYILVLCLYTYM